MKTSQLVLACAALMVMVFTITFAMNFLGSTGATSSSSTQPVTPAPPKADEKKDYAQLVFETTEYPAQKEAGKEWEIKHPGHADFWFKNPTSSEVRMALQSKSCKCTDAEMFLASPEFAAWRERNQRVQAAGFAASPIATVYALRQEAEMRNQEGQLVHHNLNDRNDEGFPVPAGGKGWVRLSWTAEKRVSLGAEAEKAQRLRAEVWMHHKNAGLVQPLDVKLILFPVLRILATKETDATLIPAKAPQQISVGTLVPSQLPRRVNLYFGSTTRSDVNLKPEIVRPPSLPAGPDPFVVGTPVRLGREETERLQTEVQDGALMSAYRVPVTLMDHVGDRLFDIGMFRFLVRINVNDGEMDPFEIPISGTVEGDVEIGGRDDRGRISFGLFNRAVTVERHILLTSEVDGLKLEVDRTRIPEFFDKEKVKLTENKQVAGAGRHTWTLSVTIPAGKVSGVFPRDDHPVYRDSAVYVKVVGASTRLVRIPVEGNAENR